MLALENVTGLLTSNSGKDFGDLPGDGRSGLSLRCRCDRREALPSAVPAAYLHHRGSAKTFQFHVSELGAAPLDPRGTPWGSCEPTASCRPRLTLVGGGGSSGQPQRSPRKRWSPPSMSARTADWHTAAETERLLAMMPATHVSRLEEAKNDGKTKSVASTFVCALERGERAARRDLVRRNAGLPPDAAGRRPRPRIIVVRGAEVRTRLLSPA